MTDKKKGSLEWFLNSVQGKDKSNNARYTSDELLKNKNQLKFLLNNKTNDELYKLCKYHTIFRYSNLQKEEIIELLEKKVKSDDLRKSIKLSSTELSIGIKMSEKPNNKNSNSKRNGNGGAIGFEDKLWSMADKLRNNMDAAEYKHVVLGLIFLKYISDSFEEKFNELSQDEYSDPEDPDEYAAENIFWVPKEARWKYIQDNSKDPMIGKILDDAMDLIEKADSPSNKKLKGVLPKIYARRELDKITLGGVIDLVGDIGLGDKDSQSKDILGHVYEYFLGKFAAAEGKLGGQFFTPTSVVRLLVEMIKPYKGRVYDPCCGSGGMFVQSEKFVQAHGGTKGDIAIYGQESNPTTWKLAMMNLAIRGIDANLGPSHGDSFHKDLHQSLKADFILANPPFNISDWGGERLTDDIRWKYGIPPTGNANFAWVQHIIHHLSPNGIAGYVLANGSLTSNTSNEGEIRKNIIEANLIDCIVQLPGQLFLTTQIPACLWFISRKKSEFQDENRKSEVLFIDARNYGKLIDRKTKELTDNDIFEISDIFYKWKTKKEDYSDISGLCNSVTIDEIKNNNYVLSPGRYVGLEEIDEINEEDFNSSMKTLSETLSNQIKLSREIEEKIKMTLGELGIEIKLD